MENSRAIALKAQYFDQRKHSIKYFIACFRCFFFFFSSSNLLIGWQISIWKCCKPFFSLQ